MNVIISNKYRQQLNTLEIDISKKLEGEFEIDEIISQFQNYFYNKMIVDITAIKDYENINNLKKLPMRLNVEKIIFLLDSDNVNKNFLSQLVNIGIYNFTTTIEGVMYLYNNPNSYRDVAKYQDPNIETIEEPKVENKKEEVQEQPMAPTFDNRRFDVRETTYNRRYILGIKDITSGAGATTLTYMLYKELVNNQKISATAVEVNKKDFLYFNDKEMLSTNKTGLSGLLLKINSQVVLVDLNDAEPDLCTDVLYLVEPSLIKMNKLMMKNRMIFSRIAGKKIVLNKCCLTKSDIREFEKECGSRLFDVIPPFDDRSRQDSIINLLARLGLVRRK